MIISGEGIDVEYYVDNVKTEEGRFIGWLEYVYMTSRSLAEEYLKLEVSKMLKEGIKEKSNEYSRSKIVIK